MSAGFLDGGDDRGVQAGTPPRAELGGQSVRHERVCELDAAWPRAVFHQEPRPYGRVEPVERLRDRHTGDSREQVDAHPHPEDGPDR